MCENRISACVMAFREDRAERGRRELTTFSSAGSSFVRIVWISGATCSPLPSRPNVCAMATSSLPDLVRRGTRAVEEVLDRVLALRANPSTRGTCRR
jgi:hypothetical protein